MFETIPVTEETDPETPERFAIDSESAANWLLSKLAAIEEEQARVKAQARKRAEELEADRNSLMGRFGPELEAWADGEAQRRRRKSVTLLQGTLAFRTTPPRLVIAELREAFEWATANGRDDLIRRELNAGEFREAAERTYRETGELLPGVDTVPATQSFSIRFPKAGKGGDETID